MGQMRYGVEKEASSDGEARDGGGQFGHTKPNAEHQLAPGNVGGRSRWSVDRVEVHFLGQYVHFASRSAEASINLRGLARPMNHP